jgi:hypothetical protein
VDYREISGGGLKITGGLIMLRMINIIISKEVPGLKETNSAVISLQNMVNTTAKCNSECEAQYAIFTRSDFM